MYRSSKSKLNKNDKLDASNKETSEYAMERKATYVYRKINGKWLCAIDNS